MKKIVLLSCIIALSCEKNSPSTASLEITVYSQYGPLHAQTPVVVYLFSSLSGFGDSAKALVRQELDPSGNTTFDNLKIGTYYFYVTDQCSVTNTNSDSVAVVNPGQQNVASTELMRTAACLF